jgi:hypothetical protein
MGSGHSSRVATKDHHCQTSKEFSINSKGLWVLESEELDSGLPKKMPGCYVDMHLSSPHCLARSWIWIQPNLNQNRKQSHNNTCVTMVGPPKDPNIGSHCWSYTLLHLLPLLLSVGGWAIGGAWPHHGGLLEVDHRHNDRCFWQQGI